MDVVVWGFGKLGQLAAEVIDESPDLRLVGVVTGRPHSVAGLVDPSVSVMKDLDEVKGNHPDAFVLHAGHALESELVETLARCADRGLDVVTSSGLFHPQTQASDDAVRLHEAAVQSGSRIVAAGLQPGFFFDALPALLLQIAYGWRTARLVKPSAADSWPVESRRMQGIGRSAARLEEDLPYPLAASAHLLVEALGASVQSITETRTAHTSDSEICLADETISPGLAVGFRQDCHVQMVDGREVTLTWDVQVGRADIDLAYSMEVEGGKHAGLSVSIDGDFTTDPYPATVQRMLHVATSVRRLSPGLHVVTDAGVSRAG